jgi:pimeloyl-ACP methyl ester carboxylesterase
MKQRIAYAMTRDGVRIAYASLGQGSPIVRTSHWMTHVQHDLSSTIWRHALLSLASRHRLISYDARGEGHSQREVDELSFDAWLTDLEAVIEAAGLDRFALFGASQGAATAIAYAASHPDRVTHLILYGGFANNRLRWDDKTSFDLARNLIRQGWGSNHDAYRQWFTSRFLPDGSADQFRDFNKMMRQSATPEIAEMHLAAAAEIDVTPLLPRIRAPTLVLHCEGDIVAPVECGREMAAAIPGARFVPLPGKNHMFLAGSPAHRAFAEEVADFLGDPPPPRVLPGARNLHEHASAMIGAVERNWLIKLALLAGAILGLALSLAQLGGAFG